MIQIPSSLNWCFVFTNFFFFNIFQSDGSTITTTTPSPSGGSNASQLVDVNKFIDKQKGKLSILAQCGCNTHLLSSYTECRLCSKFCFPDFRLSGASQQIDLCENCVETVLTLCLPTDPEVLENGEECLALNTSKVVGHRYTSYFAKIYGEKMEFWAAAVVCLKG